MPRSSSVHLRTLAAVLAAGCASAGAVEPTSQLVPSPLIVSCTDVASCGLACQEGRAETCATLAHFYETGQGVTPNMTRAVELYAQSCNGYYEEACSHLAMLYDIGMGVPQDLGKAALLYDQACALGDTWACDRKARLRSGEL